jgi:hypothetical protein
MVTCFSKLTEKSKLLLIVKSLCAVISNLLFINFNTDFAT